MPLCRRALPALLWLCMVAADGRANEVRLPALTGQLTGKFRLAALPESPDLRWTLTLRTTGPDRRVGELFVEGEGSQAQAQVEFDMGSGIGNWTLTGGELDAAIWLPALGPMLGGWAQGIAAAGTVTLAGRGEWRDGAPSGVVTIEWRDGRLDQAAQGWSIEGIAARGVFSVDGAHATARSEEPFKLTTGAITTGRFGARNLRVIGVLEPAPAIAIREASVEIAGGRVTVDPAVIPLRPLSLALKLRIDNVGLQDVAALVPSGLAESRGRINGAVAVSWDETAGFQLGTGQLELGENEPAILRLEPLPGFLTDRVPKRIALLPPKLGPIARWFEPENPAYADLEQIEQGRAALRIERLSVQLTPEGDEDGLTARVLVTASPVEAGGAVKRVTFDINVNGPLTQVIKLGLEQSFSVELR